MAKLEAIHSQALVEDEKSRAPLTREERQAIGEAHFDTSVLNVPGRSPDVQTEYREHFGRQFAELTRSFGGR